MACEFLRGRYMVFCDAVNKLYVPHFLEIREYCMTTSHSVCPLFMLGKGRAVEGQAGAAGTAAVLPLNGKI